MANDPDDDEATLARTGKVLCSDGQNEAQAYATAELRDTQRPTVEMDRVQINDPRRARTMPSIRPGTDAAPKPAVGSEPPTLDASTGLPGPRAFAEAVQIAAAIPAPPPLPAFPVEPIRDEITGDRDTLPVSRDGPLAGPAATPLVHGGLPSGAPTTAAAPATAPSQRHSGRAVVLAALVVGSLLAATFLVIGVRGGAAPRPPASTTEPAPPAAQPPPAVPPPAPTPAVPAASVTASVTAAAPPSQDTADAPAGSAAPVATPSPHVAEHGAPPVRAARATKPAPVSTPTPPAPAAKPAPSSHRLFDVEN